MRNHSNENEFDLHENEPVGGTHFHVKGFALKLANFKPGFHCDINTNTNIAVVSAPTTQA